MRILEDCFPSEYLRASDLNGSEKVVSIRSIEKMEVGSSREEKPVIFFDGMEKGLILNKTNSKTLVAMFGDETENWIGARVVLFEASVAFKSEIVQAIRIRKAQRARPAEVVKQAPVAELEDYDYR